MTSLTSRIVAAALLAAVLAACSGDDSASVSSTTRVTEDPAVVAKERMCQALETYASAESRRPVAEVDDPTLAQRLEEARTQALANLEATLTSTVPASVHDALDTLKGLSIEAASTTTTTAAGTASSETTEAAPTAPTTPNAEAKQTFAIVTDALDPTCGTDGGLTPTSSTTLPTTPTSAPSSTTAAPGATSTTSSS
jgi:hypothetical protein